MIVMMDIREAKITDAAGIARVHIDTWRSAYAGIVPADHLANMTYERCENRHRDELSDAGRVSFTFVADIDGTVVGFACGGPERSGDRFFKGELYAIYVRPEFHRQGIGWALATTIMRRLIEQGCTSMVVWALKDNQCRAFYEKLGGRYVGDKEIVIGGASLVEVAYGWDDLHNATDHPIGGAQ